MEPQHLRFGGGAAGTVLHPLVAVQALIAITLILCLRRKYAIVPFILAVFTISVGQVVVVAGIHFTVLRILILSGLVRMLVSKQPRFPGGFTAIDRLVTLWAFSSLVIVSIQLMEAQAFIKNLGDFLDLLGGYYVVRFLIRDLQDVKLATKALAAVAVVMGLCMINEQITHWNVFGMLNGDSAIPQIRDGKLRSEGAFDVYIDAGVFGAALVPMLVWLWSDRKSRFAAFLGLMGAVTMMLTCNSSTPILAFAGGAFALCLWRFRSRMRIFRWGLALTLLALHLVMNAPVWSLIARVDLTGSSSGYHRYYLVDNCIRHFSDWWLLGYKDFGNWGWDMWDLSDQYVAVCLTGGLITFVIFIALLSRSFGMLGTARKRSAATGNRKQEWFCWCLGCTLFAHVVGWFGCSYMAKMEMTLSILLATISAAILEVKRAQEVPGKALEKTYIPPVLDAVEAWV
ncbi:MAG TPA: hypothetical protein VGS27_13305 [Candidatus Sulfotelmatobacter sp.]|nr:hypothetical protein [Candidatus Sulfotelmatobacter sp.]